jgi:predicted nucleotide-binding protein (sugar kinase/HSP70/actin superfamily)
MGKSIEELLKLVEQRPSSEKKQKEDHKDVLEFIKELGIESGTQAVPNYLIFYVYRSIWRADSPKKKAKKITFFQTFGKHFPDYRKNSQRFYMLKEGLFNVNEEVLKVAKQYDKQHWQSKKTQKIVSTPE